MIDLQAIEERFKEDFGAYEPNECFDRNEWASHHFGDMRSLITEVKRLRVLLEYKDERIRIDGDSIEQLMGQFGSLQCQKEQLKRALRRLQDDGSRIASNRSAGEGGDEGAVGN